jgi:hypothetical protein
MTKDKYNLFGRKKRVALPKIPFVPPAVPFLPAPVPAKIEYVMPKPKISKIEPPEDPRPEFLEPVVRPQLTGAYLAPILPRINPEPRPVVRQSVVQTAVTAPPVSKGTATLATSTTEFFSATKALASKPRLRIPEKTVLKEVVPEPLPGSREAKLRAFIKTHF